ncbi:hypothetical protein FHT85_005222 [Rhizobium sp. BK312]|uniref:hypothetical protein n=1 Tax=Rhizobium sp. BK312 TaxID=2587080 RepID=UPI0013AF9B44|nr:hypothetical protein [Rhizobium sp. BK312]MBB3428201.1 hypothetical protein [Rhizobium sp. BK312]
MKHAEANPVAIDSGATIADSDVKPAGIPIKDRPVFDTEDYLLGQQLLASIPRDERGDFDAGKEKANHETFATNAAACDQARNTDPVESPDNDLKLMAKAGVLRGHDRRRS